jgi:hypothetical protein
MRVRRNQPSDDREEEAKSVEIRHVFETPLRDVKLRVSKSTKLMNCVDVAAGSQRFLSRT